MRKTLGLTTLVAGLIAASAAQADITVGFVTSLSGDGSSIGIPYARGIAAAVEYKSEVNGEKIRLIQLDDGSDPSAATRNARKLVEEEKVDLLIGTATAPSTIAMMAVAAGPVIVAEQLPDGHFAKKLSLDFRAAYQKANGIPSTDGFSALSFDAWRIFTTAADRALKTAKPGTVEFRQALRDEILKTNELPGVHAVYNFKPGSYLGVDERSLVMVRLTSGAWKYEP